MTTPARIFSVGHSNQALDQFLALLQQHGIEVLVDVRSYPTSTYTPHFNLESLREAVTKIGVRYSFMGRELGGRPQDPEFYDRDNHVKYDRLAESPLFQAGIDRLEKGVAKFRVAMMCSEENPADCHRHLLIARVLTQRGIRVEHIRGDGRLQPDSELAKTASETDQGFLFSEFTSAAWRSPRPIAPAMRTSQPELPGE